MPPTNARAAARAAAKLQTKCVLATLISSLAALAIAVFLTAGPARSQTTATTQFEVASFKPVPAGTATKRLTGGPGTSDPGRISWPSATLSQLLTKAFGITADQISGPAWIDNEKYATTAIVPEGTTPEQFQVMLQNLLTERLAIKLHHETRNLPAYVLTIGKSGSKLTPAAPSAGGDPPPAVESGIPASAVARSPVGRDGCPILRPGFHRMEGATSQDGLECDTYVRYTVPELVKQVSGLLMLGQGVRVSPHVIDKTGLEGAFDFKLKFHLTLMGPAMAAAVPADGSGGDPIGDNVSSLSAALADQLGLSLRKSPEPFDVIVIDKAERVPVGN